MKNENYIFFLEFEKIQEIYLPDVSLNEDHHQNAFRHFPRIELVKYTIRQQSS